MFEKIIRFLFTRRVRKYLNSQEREHRFVNYSNARTILILFESDYSEKNPEIRRIIRCLQQDGKKVSAWGYINKKEVTTAILPDFRILHQKDTDFFQKPQESFMRELEYAEYDLLLDLSAKEVIPLQYLALHAQVGCKTGIKKNDLKLYDFMIDAENLMVDEEGTPVEISATYIFNQIIFYLKSIQTSD